LCLAWTLEACLPVQMTFVGDAFGILHQFFFDITPGISGMFIKLVFECN
jgi:hypothetical protein